MVMTPLPWQRDLWTRLVRQQDAQRLPHALLISGPHGVGKHDLADALIARTLCHAPGETACGECHACHMLASGYHPDLLDISPAEKRRQIRIEGPLEEVSESEADAYFHSRPRDSQIGSAASDQSRPLPDRQVYLDRVAALEDRYPEGDIPRPPHWTGFRLNPRRIEFWTDRRYRLHDRRLFTRESESDPWDNTLLYP